jgi:hypothetical protein
MAKDKKDFRPEAIAEKIKDYLANIKSPNIFTYYDEKDKAMLSVVAQEDTSVQTMARRLREAADALERFGYNPRTEGQIKPRMH